MQPYFHRQEDCCELGAAKVCVRACVCARVRAWVRACVCVRVCVCAPASAARLVAAAAAAGRQAGRQLAGHSGATALFTHLPCVCMQLMTWSATSASIAFQDSSNVTVVLDGSLEALPAGDELLAAAMPGFPSCFFQVLTCTSALPQLFLAVAPIALLRECPCCTFGSNPSGIVGGCAHPLEIGTGLPDLPAAVRLGWRDDGHWRDLHAGTCADLASAQSCSRQAQLLLLATVWHSHRMLSSACRLYLPAAAAAAHRPSSSSQCQVGCLFERVTPHAHNHPLLQAGTP